MPNKEPSTEVSSVNKLVQKRPLTASREYGHRVQSSTGRKMQSYQTQINYGLRRNKDLLFYD